MKTFSLAMIFTFLILSSCQDRMVRSFGIEKIEMSDEALSYFEVYKDVESISFKELVKPQQVIGKNRGENMPANTTNKIWTFNIGNEFEIKKKRKTKSINGIEVTGSYENAEMTFFDEEGNEILLRYVKNLNINDEHVWEQNFDMFLVKYDNPKWKTYLCYRFNFDHFNEEDNNEKTIKSDNLTVGGKTYHDVIHLDYPLHDGMPYGIFYTQKDGIFMIRDYDLEQTWVLDKIIFKQ